MSYVRLGLLGLLLLLSACGGGGSDSESPPSSFQAVLVNAGTDQNIDEQNTLNLDGVASGGTPPYTYAWTAPESIKIEHDDTSLAAAILTAPIVVETTSYAIELTATDSRGASGQKRIVVTVNPVNELPQAIITANSIEHYKELNYPVATEIVLDGRGSFDTDPQTNDADIATYTWQQVAGIDVLGNQDANSAILTFVSPVHEEQRSLEFMLTVSDQEGALNSARVMVTLVGEQGTIPELSMGQPIAVHSGEQIPLLSTVRSRAPNAAPFDVSWTVTTAEAPLIDKPSQANTFAVAPMVSEQTEMQFEIEVKDAFGNVVSESLKSIVYPPVINYLNDTGVTVHADENGFSTNFEPEFAGQDASYGADRISLSAQDDKVGRGQAGFDFTGLNENGDPVDNTALEAKCVRDNATGLIWEVKNNIAGDLHHQDQRFTWYSEEDNGNYAGAINDTSSACNLDNGQCNTSAFVSQINTVGLCGFYDWRLPTHQELQSIVHYGKTQAPMIDTFFFPRVGNLNGEALWYWTKQSSADGSNEDIAKNAWAIDFNSGVDNFLNKTSEQRVKLVRAGRSNP